MTDPARTMQPSIGKTVATPFDEALIYSWQISCPKAGKSPVCSDPKMRPRRWWKRGPERQVPDTLSIRDRGCMKSGMCRLPYPTMVD